MISFGINIGKRSHNICRICFRTYDTDGVRVRFAPSPTGYLHLGGLRTALYNFLFAKKHNGKVILRIEDTDQTRLVAGATEQLQRDLEWSGIHIDEGPSQGGLAGPYLQSQRLNIYREQVQVLLENGSAYHCFCTERRLQLLRREALKKQEIPKYDNRCRHLSTEEVERRLEKGEMSCIRFKISEKEESFDDLIYGKIAYNISLNEGDPVIMKTDGFPTYHFANVVDDQLMKISHVLRGVEWQISTTKHLLLYRAFGWRPPSFGHLPLLMNSDGSKLSKRQGDIKISHYRESNIFPLALINFIVHSGGGFTKDLERNIKPKCYTIDELASQFDIFRINSHSGKLMNERLLEFNRLELRRKLQNEKELHNMVQQVKTLLKTTFAQRVEDGSLKFDDDHIRNVLLWSSERISKLSDLVSEDLAFIWVVPSNHHIVSKEVDTIKSLKTMLEGIKEQGDTKDLNAILKTFSHEHGIKFAALMKMLRHILSGLKEGPSVAEMMVILGKKNTLERLENCINNAKT
nr:probable glutamate--tRNA ligase, mitochondrial [Leptinotarsa decemlineata]